MTSQNLRADRLIEVSVFEVFPLEFLGSCTSLHWSLGSKKPIWIIFRSNFVAMALTFSVSTVNGTTYDISCSEADTVHALRIDLETNHIKAA